MDLVPFSSCVFQHELVVVVQTFSSLDLLPERNEPGRKRESKAARREHLAWLASKAVGGAIELAKTNTLKFSPDTNVNQRHTFLSPFLSPPCPPPAPPCCPLGACPMMSSESVVALSKM